MTLKLEYCEFEMSYDQNCFTNNYHLKVVSATFLLICFFSVKESTFETRKNAFYFTSKALFVLEKIKFKDFRYSSFTTSSNESGLVDCD